MSGTKRTQRREGDLAEAARQARRQAIEELIDEMGEQSFPARDPPAWGTLASRLDPASRRLEGATVWISSRHPVRLRS